eukprot:GHVU01066743.1.p2 GENE.GHVU01066743.1~~GHVU01066743.1.p2  ORF type:complete len:172 (+),score=28.44 GHVU01066743.1:37-552(+)
MEEKIGEIEEIPSTPQDAAGMSLTGVSVVVLFFAAVVLYYLWKTKRSEDPTRSAIPDFLIVLVLLLIRMRVVHRTKKVAKSQEDSMKARRDAFLKKYEVEKEEYMNSDEYKEKLKQLELEKQTEVTPDDRKGTVSRQSDCATPGTSQASYCPPYRPDLSSRYSFNRGGGGG